MNDFVSYIIAKVSLSNLSSYIENNFLKKKLFWK